VGIQFPLHGMDIPRHGASVAWRRVVLRSC
jgi:hypothetical protein